VKQDELYMDRALELARNGDNRTQTNPRVGAVIVYNNRILGEGWHKEFGQEHAEIQALNDIKAEDRHLVPKSTIYVTLEPCSFIGKSPSCAHRILKENFHRVVVGAIDPNPKVNGRGCRILKEAGIVVREGVRKNECERLLIPFSTQQVLKRPYIHLKWAQSYDGFLSKVGERTPISHSYLKFVTHQIRGQCQGLLVGTDTLIVDNPRLDNRFSCGDSPVKIILDRKGRIPLKNWSFLLSKGPTLGMGPENHPLRSYFDQFVVINREGGLKEILNTLFDLGVGTLMVEGGAKLLSSFISEKMWDKATIIKSPNSIKNGIQAPFLTGHLIKDAIIYNHSVLEMVSDRLRPYFN